MRDQNAQQLLARVMGWEDQSQVEQYIPRLQLLADFKYDHYQRFGPGRRFIESLALWLLQFDLPDRQRALDFVADKLIFLSDRELSHLVESAYQDVIVQERMRLVSEESGVPLHRVAMISQSQRFKELELKSLYLGLSDGARTNELRRAANGRISNEQIWQAYELGPEKSRDMVESLESSLEKQKLTSSKAKFTVVWLLDDFSGSGNTYIRYEGGKFKGKIKKIYEQLSAGGMVDTDYYEVFLLLYCATRQAVDHIEYWSERFTSERGYKPLQLRVLCPIEREIAIDSARDPDLHSLLAKDSLVDMKVADKHFKVGGTTDPRYGFAGCALPVVLSHNTPNNSLYILWGPEGCSFVGLFPRITRHKDF